MAEPTTQSLSLSFPLPLKSINKNIKKLKNRQTSGRGGGLGRNPLLLGTTKRRMTTNVKTKNNRICQKIKLHGSPTTKKLKTHSSRPIGRVERMCSKAVIAQVRRGWWARWFHIPVWISQEEQLESEMDQKTQGFSAGN